MGKLTVGKAKSLSKPGLHSDGGTLYLAVAPGGSKSWIQRITIDGKRHDVGLGGFPLVTLAEARDKAFENRRLARAGGNPLAEKRKTKVAYVPRSCAQHIRGEPPALAQLHDCPQLVTVHGEVRWTDHR